MDENDFPENKGIGAAVGRHLEDMALIGKCTCEFRKCKKTFCKGECGCVACHDSYQDFLSEE
jgi:hypothetical protein